MAGQIWDCVVVGAGPAGAAAAALAQSGRRVLMIDRVEFPRPKACGGMLSVDAVRLLPFPVMPLCRGLVRQSLLKMPQDEVILPGRAFLVRRAEFDNAYRLFAISRGATFACKKGLVRIKQRKDALLLYFADGSFLHAASIIACDGASSTVRRLLDGHDFPSSSVALEAECVERMPMSDTAVFDFSMAGRGYDWWFPLGNGQNLGRAVFGGGKIHRNAALAALHPQPDRLHWKGAAIGIYEGQAANCLGAGRVLYAGDAARLADPFTGEGIFEAILSGQLAARSLIEGVVTDWHSRYQCLLAPILGHLRARASLAEEIYRGGNFSLLAETPPYAGSTVT
jgi:flavin-dependent dehydrogenase